MNRYTVAATLTTAVWLFSAGCAEQRSARELPPAEPASVPASTPAPAPGSSSGAGTAPAGSQDKDERRGNTPPGMDRTGGGPADGAIKDPTGAATGTPEPR
jgi:hypothetical protein